jgi:hypothetical protein
MLQCNTDENTKERKPKINYFCTFCPEDFPSKQSWKAHEQYFHDRQTEYLCSDCEKEFFSQTSLRTHLRAVHGHEEKSTDQLTPPTLKLSMRKTAWGCGICSALLLDWDERCDHIAAHVEALSTREDWSHSKVVTGLFRQPTFDQAWRSVLLQKHGHHLITNNSAIPDTTVWTREGLHDINSVSGMCETPNDWYNLLEDSELDEGSDSESDSGRTKRSNTGSRQYVFHGPEDSLSLVVGRLKRQLVDRLMEDVRHLLGATTSYLQRGQGVEGTENDQTPPPVPPKDGQLTSTSMLSRKRQYRKSNSAQHPGDSGDDDNNNPNKTPYIPAKDTNELNTRFACPYYQRNPRKPKARSCAGPGWITVHRVK